MLAAAGVDESVRFHDLRHTFSTLAIQSGVDAKTVAGMLGHYSAAFTLDTYTHVTEQMKRGAAEKIGVFMNASVNVQVNVVHSPSAVVRGDYESDLAKGQFRISFITISQFRRRLIEIIAHGISYDN